MINWLEEITDSFNNNLDNEYALILLEIVKLHKTKKHVLDGRPFGNVLTSIFCDSCNVRYPCQTINKIKEMI
jgi:hypothetical protein